jgi:hypothetical protein
MAIRKTQQVARPLKVLIPMIQSELQQGNAAGQEHYRLAGEMLIEAKEQVGYGGWGRWLAKNFDLSTKTASVYMRWSRAYNDTSGAPRPKSLGEMRGDTERNREQRQSTQQQRFQRVLRDVLQDREAFVQEHQSVEKEIKQNRKLAEDLIDAGYYSLAQKLHPDRGGSKEAMARLNHIRTELKQIAQTRRFV